MSEEPTLRVLLVDDDAILLKVAKHYLTRKNPSFTIATVTSAAEAQQRLNKEFFDVIVSDYRMPDIDGLAFLKALRDDGSTIPFVIFTGQGREEVAIQALNLGADYYLMKGAEAESTFGELAHIIRQLVQRRRTEQALSESQRRLAAYESRFAALFMKKKRSFFLLGIVMGTWMVLWVLYVVVVERHSTIMMLGNFLFLGVFTVALAWIFLQATRSFYINEERKRAEEAQWETETRYRELVENLHEGVLMEDSEGFITFINPRMAKMLGYTRKELLGRHWSGIVPSEVQAKVREETTKRSHRIESRYESTLLAKDGHTIPVIISAAPLFFASGTFQGVLTVFTDITDRKQAEEALQESEERLKLAQQVAHLGFWDLN
ncbi:MAG: PAS domain S-box protein, partial [Candidatus Heimdallarchaeota archaeon]